ncbi:hypothetical protein [Marinicellulosiphila megalodicopiae]|uniref:hypothetical protein n=1 Tax=Marinicellulosiphila megalodicopiae TaxID=2724896 RepID=UPI003BB1A7C2
MKDTANHIIKEKIKHPFWSGFIIAWCFLNWKVFVDCIFKFSEIDSSYLTDNLIGINDSALFFAISIGLFNVIISPILNDFLNSLAISIQNRIKKMYIFITNERIVTKNELETYNADLNNKEVAFEKISNENDELSSSINIYKNDNICIKEFLFQLNRDLKIIDNAPMRDEEDIDDLQKRIISLSNFVKNNEVQTILSREKA